MFGSANDRITLGCIGLGGQGLYDMKALMNVPGTQVVAVCDVDLKHLMNGKDVVEAFYGNNQPSGVFKGCDVYRDFRELLARKDIDAVLIATPDHWHGIIAVEAAKSGKDIYCEKPLAYSVVEGRAIVNAVNRYKRILQTGTQRRSAKHCQKSM